MTGLLERRSLKTPDGTLLHLEGQGAPTCLMVHGLGYASWETKPLRDNLPTGYGLWSLDNRGTGQSSTLQGPCSIDDLADDAARAINEIRSPLVVIGHSMGGYIAQTLAAAYPDMVSALILIGTSPGGPRSEPVPVSTTRAWQAAAGQAPDLYARRTMPLSFRPGWPQEHPEQFEQLLGARLTHPTPQQTWRAQFAACETFLAAGLDVSRISSPTLVIHGRDDQIVPVANGRLLAEALPDATYSEIRAAGHVVHLEQPALIAETISSFMNDLHLTHP